MGLRKLRLKRGMTQQQLADKADIQRVNIVQFETGTRNLKTASFETVLKLSDALHVSNPRKLLDDSGPSRDTSSNSEK